MSDSFEHQETEYPENIAKLVESLCQNDMTAEKTAQLDELLRNNKEARRYYIRYLHMHTGLRKMLGRKSGEARRACLEALLDHAELKSELDDFENNNFENDAMPSCPSLNLLAEDLLSGQPDSRLSCSLEIEPNQGLINTIRQSFPTSIQDAIGSSTFFIGTIVFCLSIFAFMMVLLLPSNEVQNGPLALISQTVDAVWSNVTDADDLKQLSAGKLLKLESGLAQVQYQNGVLVNLQGPCSFVISGPNRGLLMEGTVSALVENGEPGFAILTPIGKVTDLGTEFGVRVKENHDVEVQTFQGLVRLDVDRVGYKSVNATMPAQSLEIRRGEAVQVDAQRRIVKPVYYAPDRFVRTYKKLNPNKAEHYVSFQEDDSEQNQAVASGVSGDDVENETNAAIAKLKHSTEPIRATLLAVNEVFVADVPAPQPGIDVLVILSSKVNDPQGGPGGGVGFQLRRRHQEGIVVQQNDSNQISTTVDSSQIDDPTPGQQLRFVIKRSSETEFVFYYQVSGIRTKITGPIANPELRGVDDFFAGVKIVPADTK